MKRFVLAAALVLSTRAHADDSKRTIFADSAAVATVRPIGLVGALQRLGPGWADAVRSELRLPQSVNPFDPAVLQLTGVDPTGVIAMGVRPLRGGLHLRATIPLAEARVADALLHSLVGAIGGTLDRGPSAWTAKLKDGTPLVGRLDGTSLVIDVVFANATMVPTPADVLHVVPLKPPRAFAGTRGLQKRMTADDAFAVWGELEGLGKLGLQREEAEMSAAIKNVDAKTRVKLIKQSQVELAQCKQALGGVTHTFDDLLFALHVTSPDQLRLELAEGGKKAALDAMRATRTSPTHALGTCGDANLCLTVTAPPVPKTTKATVPQTCSSAAKLVELATSWPALVGGAKDTETFVKVLRGVRGLFFSLPASDDNPLQRPRFTVVSELDTSTRGDVDKLMQEERFDASTPLRVDGRSLTTYSAPFGSFGIVAIDGRDGVTLAGIGTRELVTTAIGQVKPGRAAPDAPIANATIVSRGLRQLEKSFASNNPHLIDGVQQIDASLVLDDDVLHLDADFSLKPH